VCWLAVLSYPDRCRPPCGLHPRPADAPARPHGRRIGHTPLSNTAGAGKRCYLVVAPRGAAGAVAVRFPMVARASMGSGCWLDHAAYCPCCARAAFARQPRSAICGGKGAVWWRQFILTWNLARLSPAFVHPAGYQLEGHAFSRLRRRYCSCGVATAFPPR
jgi:hypothetical protein